MMGAIKQLKETNLQNFIAVMQTPPFQTSKIMNLRIQISFYLFKLFKDQNAGENQHHITRNDLMVEPTDLLKMPGVSSK